MTALCPICREGEPLITTDGGAWRARCERECGGASVVGFGESEWDSVCAWLEAVDDLLGNERPAIIAVVDTMGDLQRQCDELEPVLKGATFQVLVPLGIQYLGTVLAVAEEEAYGHYKARIKVMLVRA